MSFALILLLFSNSAFSLISGTQQSIERNNLHHESHTTIASSITCIESMQIDCEMRKDLCPLSNVSFYFDTSSTSLSLTFARFEPIYLEYSPQILLGIKADHYRPPITFISYNKQI